MQDFTSILPKKHEVAATRELDQEPMVVKVIKEIIEAPEEFSKKFIQYIDQEDFLNYH